jgi:peptidoglycan/LPS O-acetylase OafA/YrhL
MSRSELPAPESNTTLTVSAGRISGLDGLRVMAVLTIVLFHQGYIPFGWAGVQVFFVLSGYLITRILWQERQRPLRDYLVQFYGRRALRIFPLYYGVLACVAVGALLSTNVGGVRPALPYLATYTYNLWTATRSFVESSYVGHFWSLSVEEQFYLLWPLLIYFSRASSLRLTLLSVALLAPLIRLAEVFLMRSWSHAYPFIDHDIYVLTPTYVDGFALGAYVALFPLGGARKSFFVCLALVIFGAYWAGTRGTGLQDPRGMGSGYILIWGYSLVHIVAALGIDCVVHGKLARSFLDSAAMRYLGRISYGLYVFHLPVQVTIWHKVPYFAKPWRLLLEIAITIALAAASFQWWEKPFLRKKDKWFAGSSPVATVLP